MKHVGIIGFGNMGEALVNGLLKAKHDFEIGLSEKNEERIVKARERYGLPVFKDILHLVAASDMVILAVKPRDVEGVITSIEKANTRMKTTQGGIVSIVAGKETSFYRERLSVNNVARVMPNIAAKVGKALVGICFDEKADEEFKKNSILIAEALGRVIRVPEELMPAITGISGSGIAYALKFIEAMSMGGVATGIPYKQSLEITIQVLEGAIALLKESNKHPAEIISEVTSPAGTTIAGIEALEMGKFNSAVMEAIKSAANRAKELEA